MDRYIYILRSLQVEKLKCIVLFEEGNVKSYGRLDKFTFIMEGALINLKLLNY